MTIFQTFRLICIRVSGTFGPSSCQTSMQYPQPADSGNHSGHFLKVLELGGVSTNVYLRRIHNFALDTNWLSWSILPKHQWPKVKFKEKRAITLEEHQRIIAAEVNPERKTLYQLCWHLGAS